MNLEAQPFRLPPAIEAIREQERVLASAPIEHDKHLALYDLTIAIDHPKVARHEPPAEADPLPPKVTVAIKAFERPLHLRRLVSSIRAHYPDLEIVVADDGAEPVARSEARVKVLRLAPDSGLSAGRNALLSAIETPYFVLCDGDFVFGPRTKIELLLAAAQRYHLDIVAGSVLERGRSSGWAAFLAVEGDALVSNAVPRGYVGDIPLYDVVPNFFLGRTASVRALGWDERLKLGEHTDFFLRSKAAGLVCGLHPAVSVLHRPEPVSAEYRARYRELGREGQAIWQETWGVRRRSTRLVGTKTRPLIFTGATGRCGTHFLMGMAYRLLPDWIIRGEKDPDFFGARQSAQIDRALRRIEELARIGEGFLKASYGFALFGACRALPFFERPEFLLKMVHLVRDPLQTAVSFTEGKDSGPAADGKGKKYFLLPHESRFFTWRAQWTRLERNLWHWFETQARVLELRATLGQARVFDAPFHRLGDPVLWDRFRHWCAPGASPAPLRGVEVWRNASPSEIMPHAEHVAHATRWYRSLPSPERQRAERVLERLLRLELLEAAPAFA